MPRWGREVLLLFVVGGGLIGFLLFRDNLARAEAEKQKAAFSPERQLADRALRRQDWATAVENFRLLTEKDPYNGYAWFSLGEAVWNQGIPIRSELIRVSRSTVPDPNRFAELNGQLADVGREAITYFEKARETARYRLTAGKKIAAIYVSIGERQKAVDILVGCVEDGLPRRDISRDPELVEVRSTQEFKDQFIAPGRN